MTDLMILQEVSSLVSELEKDLEGDVHLFICKIDETLNGLLELLTKTDLEEIPEIIRNLMIMKQDLVKRSRQRKANTVPVAIASLTAPETGDNRLGRPRYLISEDVLINYRELGFTWTEISDMLLVSRWTIRRRIKEYGLGNVLGYSKLSDEELDKLIFEYKQKHGVACGRSMVLGYLKSCNLRIQQHRVTQSLRRIDPEGSRMRWSLIIKRRKYQVPAPNSLWHLDGHHSLINWGFVIHGGIDGFSRLIVFYIVLLTIRQKLLLICLTRLLKVVGFHPEFVLTREERMY